MSQAYSLASSASAGSQTRQHATWSPYVYDRSLGSSDTSDDDVWAVSCLALPWSILVYANNTI